MLLLLLALQATPAPPLERPNLSGRWVLNVEKSDDVRSKMPQTQASRPPDSSGPTGRHRRGSYGAGPAPAATPTPNWAALADAPKTLTITQMPTQITILDSDGRLEQLHPDADPTTPDEPRCNWQDQLLVVQSHDAGVQTSQAFSIKDSVLTVTVTLGGSTTRPISVKRVYEHPAP